MSARLTVLIKGREALPVRAIPHVNNWLRFTPKPLADCLAQLVEHRYTEDGEHITERIGSHSIAWRTNLTAYRHIDNEVVKVMPAEWDAVVCALIGFDRTADDNRLTIAAWRHEVIKHLPAGVFVWLDEFEREYRSDREGTFFLDAREGDDKLILAPMLDAETTAIAMEGFETFPQSPPAIQGAGESGTNHLVRRERIIQAFQVKLDDDKNQRYWDNALSRPPKWLRDARVSPGKRGISALWDPLLVAHALLGARKMTLPRLDAAMNKFVPALLDKWKEDTHDER